MADALDDVGITQKPQCLFHLLRTLVALNLAVNEFVANLEYHTLQGDSKQCRVNLLGIFYKVVIVGELDVVKLCLTLSVIVAGYPCCHTGGHTTNHQECTIMLHQVIMKGCQQGLAATCLFFCFYPR